MMGAIVGDIIGSVYEWDSLKSKKFALFQPQSRFTDDTVLSVAVADTLLTHGDYAQKLRCWSRHYADAGFGNRFKAWFASDDADAYQSFGNGSAMRVAPVAWAFDDLEAVLNEAQRSAEVTHNHPEGVKGAQAVAGAVYLARKGGTQSTIRRFISERFGYDLDRSLDVIRPDYAFDVTCQGSVPEAIIAFLESTDFEDCIRNAISLGGDSDTQAAIAGAIGEAFYGGIPEPVLQQALTCLDKKMISVIERFVQKYCQ
ncbi:MAG: ADP-ribosylglycohydrolase family protein [Magnetococcales bacterium]|nr:ADP-ribosylglycohydrolase family protein [Magnetococcales bacterium]